MRTIFKVTGAPKRYWSTLIALILVCLCVLSRDAGASPNRPPSEPLPPAIFAVTVAVTVKPDDDFAFATTIKNTDPKSTFQNVTLQNLAIIDVTKSPGYSPQNSTEVPAVFGDLGPGQSVTKTVTVPRHWSRAFDKYIAIYRITYSGNSTGWPAGFETGNLIGNYLPARNQ